MKTELNVLIIEDAEEDAALMAVALRQGGFDPKYQCVDTGQGAAAALDSQKWDIILCDYTMPHFSWSEALSLVKARDLVTPFIIVSATILDEVAVAAMKAGAHDIISKDKLERLAPAVRRELQSAQYRIQQRQAYERLVKSENRFRALIENSSDAVCLVNPEGRILYASPSTLRLLGYAPEELVGRNGFELVHPADQDYVRQKLIELLRSPACLVAIQSRVVRRDGVARWMESIGRNMLADPHIQAVVVNFRDITDSKNTEESLREQAQLLDLARDAIVSLRLDGTIEFWNRGAEQMYGWSKQDAVGKIIHQLLRTEFPEPPEEMEAKLLAEHRWQGVLVHTRRDGTRIDVMSRWALRQEAQGHPTGFLEITTDITERKRFDEQLGQIQKLESLGVLAGGVAHDFNNLLTGILGNASLAADTLPTNSPVQRMLHDVMDASERAAHLTRQLLAYAGKGRFVVEPVDVSNLVREISNLIQASIPKTVGLRLELDAHLPYVQGDAAQIQQLIMNLVINGAEAIAKDQSGTVLVTTAMQEVDEGYICSTFAPGVIVPGKYVRIEVRDTGVGMDEATLSRIFDPFFTTKFTGRGLGLAAAMGIVRSHKGALKVCSAPGKGSTFTVLFPATEQEPVRPPTIVAEKMLTGTGTILVIDDEELVRRTAKTALERYGYAVVLAEDGKEGVELFCVLAEKIRLVLLDMTMPQMGGEETLRRIKSASPDMKVILSSGYNELEAVQRFADKGLVGFIQKPYTAEQLAEKIKTALEL